VRTSEVVVHSLQIVVLLAATRNGVDVSTPSNNRTLLAS
jgi:hypothetical protein